MPLLDDRAPDIFARPAADLLAALRQEELLPTSGLVRDWDPSLTVVTPKTRPLAHQDPRRPHVDGLAGLFVTSPSGLITWFNPPELIIWGEGVSDSYLLHQYEGLGASLTYTAFVDIKIFLPAATSVDIQATGNPATIKVTIQATGNPATIKVTNQATGNLRVTVPITLTANSAGQATVLLRPGAHDQGFVWYGTDLHKPCPFAAQQLSSPAGVGPGHPGRPRQ